MDTNQIVTLCVSAVNLINFAFYFFILKKNSKAIKSNDLMRVIEMIPNYVKEARERIGTGNNLAVTNYVLAMLNRDCQNLKIKYQEKQLKKEVEKEIKKEEQVQ